MPGLLESGQLLRMVMDKQLEVRLLVQLAEHLSGDFRPILLRQ